MVSAYFGRPARLTSPNDETPKICGLHQSSKSANRRIPLEEKSTGKREV
jgi:hypothetical protein